MRKIFVTSKKLERRDLDSRKFKGKILLLITAFSLINLMKKIFLFACLTLGLGPLSPVFAEPSNLSLLTQEIQSYYNSGKYNEELAQIAAEAQLFLSEEVKNNKENKRLALVLDIDETCLSNYDKMLQRNFVADLEKIHLGNLEGNSPAILPMLALYQEALKQGIKVFFVTGREKSELEATRNNLIQAGFKNWTGLYLRPSDYHPKSIAEFKAKKREALTLKGYTIIASIGDQLSDLEGGFVKKGFKLPNPFYYLP